MEIQFMVHRLISFHCKFVPFFARVQYCRISANQKPQDSQKKAENLQSVQSVLVPKMAKFTVDRYEFLFTFRKKALLLSVIKIKWLVIYGSMLLAII